MKKRYLGLDINRIIAVLMVIGIHSLSWNGYYNMPLKLNSGPLLFLLTMLRWLFYACVPMFIIITGYLKKDKKINKNHYKSLLPIIVDYLIICLIYILYNNLYLKINIFNIDTIINIFNFNLIPYAWYLQLYIGLFLMIPFLNIMYNNMPTKKSKKILIITIVLLCGLHSTINPLFKLIFNVNSNLIFSSYLPIGYPLALYFLGAYIKEYQPKIPKIKNIFFIILIIFIQTTITYFYCQGNIFQWVLMEGYGNIFTITIAGLVFCLFYNIELKKENKLVSKILSYLSSCSFSVYLASFIIDMHFYKYIKYLNNPWYKIIILLPISIILHYLICIIVVSIINILKKYIKKLKYIYKGVKRND